MRSYDPTELAYLQSRSGVSTAALVWVTARNRTSGTAETLGLWTGSEDRDFVIGGSTRTYFGAGAVLGIDAIVMQTGLVVRMQRVTLSTFSAAVQQLILGYDAALAPCEIHRALFDPETGNLIAAPRRVWKGNLDKAPMPVAAIGSSAGAEVQLASAARSLTRGLTLTKSDASQSLRGGDRFRRYQDVTGKVSVSWGEKRV